MALSISSVVADLESVVAEAKKGLPAIEILLSWAKAVAPLLPAQAQALDADAVAVLTALVDVLSKV
jgi:hypothetical protein